MKRAFDSMSAGVQRKKQKIRSARTIATESASPSLRSGAIPIHEFLSSRRFEINALTESVQKSREAGVQRAFQSLPRYLRRRAASHNVKRVPKRLRGRAIAELKDEDQIQRGRRVPFKRKRGRKETVKRLLRLQKQSEENQQPSLVEPVDTSTDDLPVAKHVHRGRFANRQRDKTWLPSHLWTCKRAKMETKWNYSLAISPNEKTYRSTHRASSSKGAIIFDTSYQGSILLKGDTSNVCKILAELTCTKSSCGSRARTGQRMVPASLYSMNQYLCPVEVIWDATSTEALASVLLVVHPDMYATLWRLILQFRRELNMDNLKVFDMRFDIGSITVVGPLATNALLSVLKSSHSTNVGKAFKSFHGLRPDELGAYSIYSFQIKDPRRSFPPKLITEPASKDNQYLLDCTTKPDASSLFCHSSTRACNENKPSSVGIKVTDCPDIPVLVYQSKLGLVVLTPWAYVTDIWYNLNHLPLVRFGGLQELAQIHYERSLPFFPTDYQGTEAGDKAAKEDRNKREKWYLRRPPAKRLSYKKSINGKPEIGDPFTCDFYYLINTPADQTQSDVSHVTVSVVENPSLNDTTMDDTYLSAPLYTSTPLIILPSTQTPGSVPKQSASQDPPIIVDTSMQENSNPLKPVLFTSSQLKTLTTEDQECGIMHVRIRMVQRGSPKACARIYHCEGKQPGHLIGFLTTGNYSLAEGRATGIASLRAKYIREHVGDRKKQCFVRDSGSGHFRLASWELIHT